MLLFIILLKEKAESLCSLSLQAASSNRAQQEVRIHKSQISVCDEIETKALR